MSIVIFIILLLHHAILTDSQLLSYDWYVLRSRWRTVSRFLMDPLSEELPNARSIFVKNRTLEYADL